MVQAQPESDPATPPAHTKRALVLLASVSALMSVCAKKAGQVSRKVAVAAHKQQTHVAERLKGSSSPLNLKRPKKLLSSISSKAMIAFAHHRKKDDDHSNRRRKDKKSSAEMSDEEECDFGDGGVWQRTILMGDKCQPLDFSGVIYYDEYGNKLNHVPLRSPRASPLPSYLVRAEQERVSNFEFGGLGK